MSSTLTPRRALTLTLVGLILAAPSWAVTLRYKFKPGEKTQFRDQLALTMERIENDLPPARMQLRSDSKIRQTTKQVDGGVATIEVETTENSTEAMPENGKSHKSEDKGDPERIKIDARGLIADRTDLGKPKDGPKDPIELFDVLQEVLDHLALPAAAVDPGDTWNDTFEVTLLKGAGKPVKAKVDVNGTFERLVTIKGVECAELTFEFEVPLDVAKPTEFETAKVTAEGKLMGKLTSYLAIERGEVIAESSTAGGHVVFSAETPKKTKGTLALTFKLNTKTHLEE